MEIIRIPQKRIAFTKGELEIVREFAIAACPISTADYALFAKRSGYVTDAERRKKEFTVYSNPSVEGIPFTHWNLVPAIFVSRNDVVKFCEFHRVSLPTPTQWISFVQHAKMMREFALQRRSKLAHKLKIQFSAREWLGGSEQSIGRPPMLTLPRICHAPINVGDLLLDHEDKMGDISITFRIVFPSESAK
jgi:hypothetical protein